MSSRRRIRRAFRLLEACLLVVALSWHQMIATPLMVCMLADDSASVMDCPAHGDTHANHHAHPTPPSERETGARIQCADSCDTQALTVMAMSAPVPDRVGMVLLYVGGVLVPIHDDSDPGGRNVAPGVPPPRS